MRILMRYFALGLFVMISAVSWGQFDTLYFDHNWQQVTPNIAEYYRVCKPDPLYGYMLVDHYRKNDSIQKIGYCKSKDISNKSVSFIYYDEKMNATKQGLLKNNKETGKWTYYYQYPKYIWHTNNYTDGKLDG